MTEHQCIFKKILEHCSIHFNPLGEFYEIRFKRMDGKIVSMNINSDKEAYWDCEAEMLKREIKMKEERNNARQ